MEQPLRQNTHQLLDEASNGGHFEAVFGTLPGGAKRSMMAITDGQLQSKVNLGFPASFFE